jgi:hypothetical protein
MEDGWGRGVARWTAAVLVAGLVPATVSVATAPEASAACAPVALHHSAQINKVPARVRSSRVTVRKVHRKRFVATVKLTGTAGTAKATASQTVCPGGSAGAAVVSTQARSARGEVTRTVTRRASTRAKATASARHAARKAKAKVRRNALRWGRRIAVARATAAARAAVYDDLFVSHIVNLWGDNTTGKLWVRSDAASFTLGTMTAVSGGLRLVVPGEPADFPDTFSLPCLTRAKAWPTTFASGEGTFAWAGSAEADVDIYTYAIDPAAELIADQWAYSYDATTRTVESTGGGLDPAAGKLLCLDAQQSGSSSPGVATLRGLKLGSGYTGADEAARVTGPFASIVVR